MSTHAAAEPLTDRPISPALALASTTDARPATAGHAEADRDWQRALHTAAANWAESLREQYQLIDTGRADEAARRALGADYTPPAARRWLGGVSAFRAAH